MKKRINKNNLVPILLILGALSMIFFVYHNDAFYSKTIVKCEKVETSKTEVSTNAQGFKEQYYKQNIIGMITNGNQKGKEIKLANEYADSLVVTEKYKVGNKVFVDGKNIEGLKRDTYMVTMTVLFIVMLYFIGKVRGLTAIISVIFNILIFYFGLYFYFKGMNLLLLCMIESLFFTVFSLLLAGGKNKKTVAAILSVIASTILLFIMTYIVISVTHYKDISFNEMNFLTVPVEDVFMASLMIGGLGAIMDIAITMASSIAELIQKDNKISTKALIKSGTEIGKDIFSTMINVLFFTYLCGSLPIFVLSLRNGFTLYNYITSNFSIELSRFFVGSIGIILTISISLLLSIFLLKRGDTHE
ncbi:MAG: YibE/F family protein [Bacilli bacterium]|nr:YibE/F family protein [Bacilli bacterium]